MVKHHISEDKAALSGEVAALVVAAAADAAEKRGKFIVALSGGSLPGLLSSGLSDLADQVDWSKVV